MRDHMFEPLSPTVFPQDFGSRAALGVRGLRLVGIA
jgi:hypothetical protein